MPTWTNWAGCVTATPARLHRPRDVAGIVAAVRAAAAGGSRLRPVGSGHSFTPIAATDGHALDLRHWTGLDTGPGGLVRVRSGTTLRELNALLHARGRALENLGDIDSQTVAGAISTGTHGTGARLGGLATQVHALELVLADGTAVRCSDTEDPELFAAARVGLGALGVLTHVTLRTVPAFLLDAREEPVSPEEALAGFAAQGGDRVEFYWFPYSSRALLKRNVPVPGSDPAPLSRARAFWEYEVIENAAFGALCRVGRAVPSTVRPLGGLTGALLSPRHYRDWSHRVLVSVRRVRFVESEFAVPAGSLPQVLAELRGLVARLPDPVQFPVEVRAAAADDIWLSTAYGRDTAYVAVHQYAGAPYREYFAGFGAIAREVGGRPHWGKLHGLDAAALRDRYPRFDDFLAVRARVDPRGLFGNDHLDRTLGAA
jgi:L-gulono-1,4-lactone dehydrogenase